MIKKRWEVSEKGQQSIISKDKVNTHTTDSKFATLAKDKSTKNKRICSELRPKFDGTHTIGLHAIHFANHYCENHVGSIHYRGKTAPLFLFCLCLCVVFVSAARRAWRERRACVGNSRSTGSIKNTVST
jgi:hypothetical protein